MFIWSFGFHHGNLFDFSLQNEEPVVVKIDSVCSQEFSYLLELDTLPIYLVERRVILKKMSLSVNANLTKHMTRFYLECSSCNHKLRAWYHCKFLIIDIFNQLEVDCHRAALNIWVVLRVVYKNSNTFGSNFLCSVSKDKKHGINNVAFATSVRADD